MLLQFSDGLLNNKVKSVSDASLVQMTCLARVKFLKHLSIKTEHYHTSFFLLQKTGGAVSDIVWVDAIKVKLLQENYTNVSCFFFLSAAENTSNRSALEVIFLFRQTSRATLYLFPVSHKFPDGTF